MWQKSKKKRNCLIKPWKGFNAFRSEHIEMGTISVQVCYNPKAELYQQGSDLKSNLGGR